MKDIKDYLHFYLKCWGQVRDSKSFKYMDGEWVLSCGVLEAVLLDNVIFKPYLRPLSSMTEDEAKECGNLVYDFSDDEELNNWNWKDYQTLLASEQFIWLLSKCFDLFNLIEEGLAIDSTKQNSEPAAQESDTTNDK